MALFSPPARALSPIPCFPHQLAFFGRKRLLIHLLPATSMCLRENGAGISVSAAAGGPKGQLKVPEMKEASGSSNGFVKVGIFEDPKWVCGTWDLKQFERNGNVDWDGVIDAEIRRRKWLENHPESPGYNDPVVFDTFVIPWWAWIKRFHLPEAELLNGRASMIGILMAYLVDSLTGAGLVDQTSNFFCKILLFVVVVGVLLVRKNEDVENIKKLIEEITLYDKQWQSSFQDGSSSVSENE